MGVTTVCQPGFKGTPNCREVMQPEDVFCKYAHQYAMKAAKDASSVTLAKGLRIKMEAAELAAVRYTEDARHKLTHAIAMHHEAKATFVKEHALLQEVDRRVEASAVITDAFEERQIACAHGARGHRQSLTEVAGLVATAQALPKRPWRLPKKNELAIRYDASALTLKKIKATALKAAERGKDTTFQQHYAKL